MEKKKILIFISKVLLLISGVFIYLGLINIQKGYSGCDKNLDCYFSYYTNLVNQKGVSVALQILKKDYASNPYVVAECHSLTHIIGRAAYSMYPNISDVFNQGDPFCSSGYYHGAMEEISEKIGVSGLKKNINQICADVDGSSTYSNNYFNCVHGLGHGVMSASDNELFDALKICDLMNGEYERQNCYGGVFMENVVQDGTFQNSKYLKTDNLMYPCDAVAPKYKRPCYLMQPTHVLLENNRNFSEAFLLCRNADKDMLSYCLDGVGREAIGQVDKMNYKKVKNICDLGTSIQEKSFCAAGVVRNIVSYFHDDKQAKAFCSVWPEEIKTSCLAVVTDYYKNF